MLHCKYCNFKCRKNYYFKNHLEKNCLTEKKIKEEEIKFKNKDFHGKKNFELLIKMFDKNFIDNISKIFYRYSNVNKYFKQTGKWNNNCKNIPEYINIYFNYMFYKCNYDLLIHILNNIDSFKNKIFLDYGAGFGLLSIFLSKIGIKCYNYDNFNQKNCKINKRIVNDFHNEIYKKLNIKIEPVYDNLNILMEKNIQIVMTSGIWIDDEIIFTNHNINYYFLDKQLLLNIYEKSKKKYFKKIIDKFRLVKQYDAINIYEK